MVTDFVRPTSMEVPDGGLASFLNATVGEWADTDDDDDIPRTGIGGVKSVADKLAEYGRYEDSYMIHAAQGETVIPMAVFDENPRLQASLFQQMREMGIDPEQYVVGNELNSINPVTGQPEFFLKKLFKGLKKAVKSVVKVFKKVAPIVLAIGLSMTPLGVIAGSALGSGIGTLIQGGSMKDALKMGAIGGLTAGLFQGVTGAIGSKMQGGTLGGGFKAGVQAGLPDAYRASQAAALNQAAVQGSNALLPPLAAPAGSGQLTTGAPVNTMANVSSGGGRLPPADIPSMTVKAPVVSTPLIDDLPFRCGQAGGATAAAEVAGPKVTSEVVSEVTPKVVPEVASEVASEELMGTHSAIAKLKPRGAADSFKNLLTGPERVQAAKDFFLPSSVSAQDVVTQQLGQLPGTSVEVLKEVAASGGLSYNEMFEAAAKGLQGVAKGYQPGLARTFLPAAGLGMLGLGASGGFEAPEMDESVDPFGMEGKTGWDLIDLDPSKYSVFPQGAPYRVPYIAPLTNVATGGEMERFPPRDGSITGPGTGTSDDIPAMLSDGEFVMTAQAVRGAGNGNRKQGVRRMYDIMRSYEGAA